MDIASLIGFVGAVGMIAGSMAVSGGIGSFLHMASTLIVVGGTLFGVMYSTPLPRFLAWRPAPARRGLHQEQLQWQLQELFLVVEGVGLVGCRVQVISRQR